MFFSIKANINSLHSKAKFFIGLNEVNICDVLFCGSIFLQEFIFADRGQSAKIKTRNIFMQHGMPFLNAKKAFGVQIRNC